MANIIWLASYPKSGNTWFRSYLSNLLLDNDEPVDINSMKTDGIASRRDIFDEVTGVEASELTLDEVDNYRRGLYKMLSEETQKDLYIKVHDAYSYLKNGTPMFPKENAKVIYIVRNPLDVAVSFSFHLAKDIDNTIKIMGDKDFCLSSSKEKLGSQLRQKLFTWSGNIESWVDNGTIPVEVIRYEDMKNSPFETFKRATLFAGIKCDDEKIKKAIDFSDFKVLKRQEENNGFNEKPPQAESFFREGKTGGWRAYLGEEQVSMIINDHEKIMKRFGYLDKEGNIVY